MKAPQNMKPGIAWKNVPAPVLPGDGNTNEAEASAIASHLQMLLVDEEYPGTVGVITSFRRQIQMFHDKIAQKLPDAITENADLRIATVDGFQGQDRDLLIFSPVLNSTSAQTGISFIQKDWCRLNVAISRARTIAHIFGDLEVEKKLNYFKSIIKILREFLRWKEGKLCPIYQ